MPQSYPVFGHSIQLLNLGCELELYGVAAGSLMVRRVFGGSKFQSHDGFSLEVGGVAAAAERRSPGVVVLTSSFEL